MNNRNVEPEQGSWEVLGIGSRRLPPQGGVSSQQRLGIATVFSSFLVANQHFTEEQVKFVLSLPLPW